MIVSAKQLPKLKKRQLSTKQASKANFKLGVQGEKRAVLFLKSKNIEIWDSNIEYGKNEIDLIGFDPKLKEIIFFEIKTRSSVQFGDPSSAVNRDKIRSMTKVAQIYCQKRKLTFDYRFDILAITPDKIKHYTNITM